MLLKMILVLLALRGVPVSADSGKDFFENAPFCPSCAFPQGVLNAEKEFLGDQNAEMIRAIRVHPDFFKSPITNLNSARASSSALMFPNLSHFTSASSPFPNGYRFMRQNFEDHTMRFPSDLGTRWGSMYGAFWDDVFETQRLIRGEDPVILEDSDSPEAEGILPSDYLIRL